MSFKRFLLSLSVKLEKKQSSIFNADVKEQMDYVDAFGEPVDDIERSFYQYKCQMKLYGKGTSALLNILAFPVALVYFLSYKRITPKKQRNAGIAVFIRDGKPENIMPESLRAKFTEVVCDPQLSGALANEDSIFIWRVIKRYPFSWFFILKNIIKIALYRGVIERYQPESILVCSEYSFTSSLLTAYCKENGVTHINIMHGEKLLFIRDSFFRFDYCYVWDTFYVELFTRLKADPKQFLVEIPLSLVFLNQGIDEKKIDYCYYLGAEEGEILRSIVQGMKRLREKGMQVAIRPHPRYSNINEIKRIAPQVEIEDYRGLSIETSLRRTKNAVSVYSTVLNQAYHNGVGIVIDDVSDRTKFSKLKELHYIMLNKDHQLWSAVLEDKE